MFIGNMVTEAIPARVFALYTIVASKNGISRSELKELMEPSGIFVGSSYFNTVLNTAVELKLIEIQDNYVSLLVSKENMKSIDDFRLYVISKLEYYEGEQFYRCTNAIVNLDDKIFKHSSVAESEMLSFLSDYSGQQVTAPMARGWRFWAQFIGIGYMNEMAFLPNAYTFIKQVMKLMELEKGKEYQMDEFMAKFNQYGRILTANAKKERYLNLALSNGFRELHDNGEIVLKYISDQEANWSLYPSAEAYKQPVQAIIYKGVKR